MNAWATSNVCSGPFEAENVSTFNTVIKTWARSGLPESGERAETLLDYMTEQVKDYDEEGRGYIHNSEDYYNNEDDANIVRPN
eukprot:12314068-Ditylum_brightwellii.AAC.1